VVTLIVPLALLLTPFSLKISAGGVGVGGGVAIAGLGDGEVDELGPPVPPHAATVNNAAVKATAPFTGAGCF